MVAYKHHNGIKTRAMTNARAIYSQRRPLIGLLLLTNQSNYWIKCFNSNTCRFSFVV